MKLPDLKGKVCTRCLYAEGDPELQAKCPDSPNGQHRLKPKHLWMGVVASGVFDIKSQHTARKYFGEGCWDADQYVLAQEFSDEDAAALADGSKRLILMAVPNEAA